MEASCPREKSTKGPRKTGSQIIQPPPTQHIYFLTYTGDTKVLKESCQVCCLFVVVVSGIFLSCFTIISTLTEFLFVNRFLLFLRGENEDKKTKNNQTSPSSHKPVFSRRAKHSTRTFRLSVNKKTHERKGEQIRNAFSPHRTPSCSK